MKLRLVDTTFLSSKNKQGAFFLLTLSTIFIKRALNIWDGGGREWAAREKERSGIGLSFLFSFKELR